MLAKLAILFLVVMAAMALILARPKRRGGKPVARGKPKGAIKSAAKCPDCGAWIVEGARCPCKDGARG